jgi:hypothetical protein
MEHQIVRCRTTSRVEDIQVGMTGQPPLIASVIVPEALHRDIIHQDPTEQHTLRPRSGDRE